MSEHAPTLDERRAALAGKLADTMDPDGAAEMVREFEHQVARQLLELVIANVAGMRWQCEPGGGAWTVLNDVLFLLRNPPSESELARTLHG